jgi:hypothetical protein
MERCAGCYQPIDREYLTTHVWTDEDDKITVIYHPDCCPGKHVSEGECQDTYEDEYHD